MGKKFKIILFIFLIMLFFSPLFQYIKSLIVMSANNYYQDNHSLLKEEQITLKMPGGLSTPKKDWYPLVNIFNQSEGFSDYYGNDVKLSILYNFASFDYSKGYSYYYDETSEFFNAFYGAYIVKGNDVTFGYDKNGLPDYSEMAMVPKYDMEKLVLKGFGCEESTFDFSIDNDYIIDLFDYKDWNVIEATIITNSPLHKTTKYKQAYLQYGKPPKNVSIEDEFKLIKMMGKFYSKYFIEKDCSIFFYIIARQMDTINEWENQILKETVFRID